MYSWQHGRRDFRMCGQASEASYELVIMNAERLYKSGKWSRPRNACLVWTARSSEVYTARYTKSGATTSKCSLDGDRMGPISAAHQ